MAAPTFHGAGALGTATSGTTISAAYPASIAADDVAYLTVWCNGNITPSSTPTGYTQLALNGNATFSYALYRKVLDGSETTFNVTMGSTMSITDVGAARLYVYRDADTTTVEEDVTVTGPTTSQTPASGTIDTTDVDRLVVCLCGIDNDMIDPTDWSDLPASGWTLDGSVATWNETGDGTVLGVSKTQSTAATVSGSTIGTYTGTSSPWVTFTFGLLPGTPPALPPDAVDDLAGTAGDEEVELTWTAPADNGEAITDYIVQYRTAGTIP